jgi:hypothetical protein
MSPEYKGILIRSSEEYWNPVQCSLSTSRGRKVDASKQWTGRIRFESTGHRNLMISVTGKSEQDVIDAAIRKGFRYSEPIEVRFGDEYIGYDEPLNEHNVIIQINDDGSLAVSGIFMREGKEVLSGFGSGYRRDIRTIVGRWDIDRIIAASRIQWEDIPEHFESKMIPMFQKEAAKPPRIISETPNEIISTHEE